MPRRSYESPVSVKALILAAGLGVRLRPHTLHRPKPLFSLAGVSLLEIWIHHLAAAGCTDVAVNGHWRQEMIAAFLKEGDWPVPVLFRPEPELLGTGGAIRNLLDFWDDAPFFVVNADAAADTDLAALARIHRARKHAATLLLCDDARANSVSLDPEGRITGFPGPENEDLPRYCFTGIQVLSPAVFPYLPPGPSSSIRAFERMIADGRPVGGTLMPARDWWMDIGAPDRYRQAALRVLAASAFSSLSSPDTPAAAPWVSGAAPGYAPRVSSIRIHPLAGDGSDRRWYRAAAPAGSVILVDHGDWGTRKESSGTGFRPETGAGAPGGETGEQRESDAFIDLARHFEAAGLPTPRLLARDRYAGMAAVTDLGDVSLQRACRELRGAASGSWEDIVSLYRDVIDAVWSFHNRGGKGFDPAWCWQTQGMDAEMIRTAECAYFVRAFVRNLAGWSGPVPEAEFDRLARRIGALSRTGIIHRDCQSRNIMICGGRPYFIDFQGARRGPFAYDLASLLIDPYAGLPPAVQTVLLDYAASRVRTAGKTRGPGEKRQGRETEEEAPGVEEFRKGYPYCALSRNLQMLGAFAFLSREKGKAGFADYIPAALNGLVERSCGLGDEFPELCRLALRLRDR
ncbi:MAG: hypothetical protein CSB33_04240 [Desulfobacterales bacterium]|nr:MAG: hypothetical protein CSB33_04240 [Desulfobacterales bacterium]